MEYLFRGISKWFSVGAGSHLQFSASQVEGSMWGFENMLLIGPMPSRASPSDSQGPCGAWIKAGRTHVKHVPLTSGLFSSMFSSSLMSHEHLTCVSKTTFLYELDKSKNNVVWTVETSSDYSFAESRLGHLPFAILQSVYSSVKWGWNSADLTLLLLQQFTVNILFISHKWNEWEPRNTCDMTTVSSPSVWKASCIIAGAVLHACLTATSQGISSRMPWKHLVLLLCAWLVWVSEGRYRKESWKPWAGWCSVLRSGTGRHKWLHLQTLFLGKLPEPCTPFLSPWVVCLNLWLQLPYQYSSFFSFRGPSVSVAQSSLLLSVPFMGIADWLSLLCPMLMWSTENATINLAAQGAPASHARPLLMPPPYDTSLG